MTGKYADAAEQAILRTALYYDTDYIEHAAAVVAARQLRAFADILDSAADAESAVPTVVRIELGKDTEATLARLREIIRLHGTGR